MKEGELKIGNYFFYIFRALYTVQNSPLTKSINCVAAETFIAKNWKKLHNARQLQSTKDDYWGELVISQTDRPLNEVLIGMKNEKVF